MALRRDSTRSACVRLVLLASVLVAAASVTLESNTTISHAAVSCSQGTTLNIVAHEDDDIIFLSPHLLHDIQAGRCVRTVFITAGDAGRDAVYWLGREAGAQAAYAFMTGVPSLWIQTDAGITGHPAPLFTLSSNPFISLVFLRLPDGAQSGGGFATTNYETLQKLWLGSISVVHAVDGSSGYTKDDVTGVLARLMTSFQPDQINTQDYMGTYGDGDHSDHHSVAYFAQAAQRIYSSTHSFTGYKDYVTKTLPVNVIGADLPLKRLAFQTYGHFDARVCGDPVACINTDYGMWLQRQYTVCATPGLNQPFANAGPLQSVPAASTVELDGTCSSDPGGLPLTYSWTQTAGPPVVLSGTGAVQPTFVAPATAALLSFALVVTNGVATSSPATVSISVSGAPSVASATATASASATPVAPPTATASASATPVAPPTATASASATPVATSTATPTPTSTPTPTPTASATPGASATPSPSSTAAPTVTNTLSPTPSVAPVNLARLATASASSENASTSQTADKAIDGVIDGWPRDYTREWATIGGKAGSWLKLTWTSPQTVNRIVLYDRPNLNDQITGATIQFSDGTALPVGVLNNDGTGVTLEFTARTITSFQLTITSVAPTTRNIGLAEVQVYGP